MLEPGRIASIIAADKYSRKKKQARLGQKYYDGEHDILAYRIYYINKEGRLVEDLTKSNIRIPHPFFQEISEQEVAYILSGGVDFQAGDEELGKQLKTYFGDDFVGAFKEVLIDAVVRGFGYIYWYKDTKGRTRFQYADSLGIVEVKDGAADDTVNDYIIRYYAVEIKDGKTALRIEVWDKDMTWYYLQSGSSVELDKNIRPNPCPHVLYQSGDGYYYEECDRIPFLKLSYNRKECSRLKQIKPIIDDYDLMNCGLSNNLQDITEGIYVVKGFKGQDYDEMLQNVKSRKVVGVGEKGDMDIKTINIPYEARLVKMNEDEKNIYRTALAFNSSQTGDGNITNIILKSRYTLLDMKARKFIWNIKEFLGTLLEIVLGEINAACGTAYEKSDVEIRIDPVVPTDEKEDAEIRKLEAGTAREKVGTLLDAADTLGEDILLKEVGGILGLDEETVRQRMEQLKEDGLIRGILNGQAAEGSTAGAV
ncbi:MAG: phage portal protein [Lachnospiraceae bacterium]|nr:phage portal protein [Butyrivibrio sp.]MCM1344015.1 phage portal protein [Muribaculaceae bacterium]MCM1411518.1 phage portal protein [Lachnospiraceae bacterium]